LFSFSWHIHPLLPCLSLTHVLNHLTMHACNELHLFNHLFNKLHSIYIYIICSS
jgi:hypothetical protein